MASCDCYVSLHRSEGFGLTLAEAMAYGTPVIGTAYGGNLEFMNEQNSYLVPFSHGRVPEGCDPYPAGIEWAEPDLESAAELMRNVFEHQDEARERGQRGQHELLATHSVENAAAFVSERIAEIRATRRSMVR